MKQCIALILIALALINAGCAKGPSTTSIVTPSLQASWQLNSSVCGSITNVVLSETDTFSTSWTQITQVSTTCTKTTNFAYTTIDSSTYSYNQLSVVCSSTCQASECTTQGAVSNVYTVQYVFSDVNHLQLTEQTSGCIAKFTKH